MTDFSFTNRAYDLLCSLKEENIINPKNETKQFRFNNINELRLMIDLIKTTYPLYANADNKTIVDFINDAFDIMPIEWQVNKANHKEPIYRPIEIWEINPGVKCRLEGICCDTFGKEMQYYYIHTFPTKDMEPIEYNRQFMKIWKNMNPCIENKFKFKIGDTISHKDDSDSIGYIKGRLPAGKLLPKSRPYQFIQNQYSISWSNIGTNENVSISHWFNEEDLINNTKLEAMPMKTVVKKGKNKQVTNLVFDKELYDTLMNFYHYTLEEIKEKKVGWIEETTKYIQPKRKSGKVRRHLKELKKLKRIKIHQQKLATYKPRPKRYTERIQDPLGKSGKIDTVYHKLVCVKHISTGVIARVRENLAKELVIKKNSGNYAYASKLEWRQYLKLRAKNIANLNPPKHTKISGTEGIGNTEVIEGIVRKNRRANNKTRRHSRLVKEQFVPVAVPEEKVSMISRKPTLNEYDGDILVGKMNFKTKFIIPAYVKFKRILTTIQPRKVESVIVTPEVIEQRKERSMIDKAKYLEKKNLKSLDTLKEEFANEERRNEKHSPIEKWTNIFEKLIILITQNKLYNEKYDKIYVNSKSIPDVIKVILDEIHIRWTKEKIKDFIRYIRLTTHSVFGIKTKSKRPIGLRPIYTHKDGTTHGGKPYKKPCRIKKPTKQVEFETIKKVTRIDYSKLKQNLPNVNSVVYIKFNDADGEIEKVAQFKDGDMYLPTGDFLCSIRDVTAWKYKKDKEYQEVIIDEGGGIQEVGIKFRRKNPEHLKIYFERQKKKKNDKVK